jgi:uncharacterized RDD family membrane protein YckC
MRVRVETRFFERQVRADLVDAAVVAARAKGVSLAVFVAWALTDYLARPGPLGAWVDRERSRLPVRLPVALIGELEAHAATARVSDRLVLEAALARVLEPTRAPGWNPNPQR